MFTIGCRYDVLSALTMHQAWSVGYTDNDCYALAKQLSERLHLPINNHGQKQLFVTPDKLGLKISPFSPFFIDFNSISLQKKTGLLKACKPVKGMRIIDATAGLGRDAAILASHGAKVIMLERHPMIAALLEDAIARFTYASQMTLHIGEAQDYLQQLNASSYPDIIYIDPMHPQRTKSACVKKEMQILQQLVSPDVDALDLLTIARDKALKKVIVKWPQKQASLSPPHSSIHGKTIKFDIYASSHSTK